MMLRRFSVNPSASKTARRGLHQHFGPLREGAALNPDKELERMGDEGSATGSGCGASFSAPRRLFTRRRFRRYHLRFFLAPRQAHVDRSRPIRGSCEIRGIIAEARVVDTAHIIACRIAGAPKSRECPQQPGGKVGGASCSAMTARKRPSRSVRMEPIAMTCLSSTERPASDTGSTRDHQGSEVCQSGIA